MTAISVPNKELLEEKIAQIKKDGISHLHVVSDFDRTLTPAFIHGKKPSSSFMHLRDGNYLSQEYVKQAFALFDQYHPIEISESIPLEEKKEAMKEWWHKHLDLMVAHGMRKEIVEDIVRTRNIGLREYCPEFFALLAQHHVPLLIFSAGLGDIIRELLHLKGLLHHNIRIISNFFDFGSDGKAHGYKSDIIHVFNKNEGIIVKSEYHKQIEQRRNVLLLGDSLGDSQMLEGLKHDIVIKIGFLNENADKLREQYKKEFDVLIEDENSMKYVVDLLKQIL